MAVQVGIVGLGTWGAWHAGRLRQLPGFNLRSVCDITPERRQAAERDFGCPAHADLEEFLADDRLQMVIVATPSHAHETPVLRALRRQARAVRKAAGPDRDDCPPHVRRRPARRRTLMTFQNRRGDADFLTAKKVVDSGQLGRLFDIRLVHWGWTDVMRKFGVKSFRPAWRTEAAYGGGTLLDFGPHHFDQLLQIVRSPIASVFADLRGRRWTKDADDQFLAILRTTDGTVVQLEYSQNAHVPMRVDWAINGEDAGFRYDEKQSFLYSHSARGREKVRPVKNVPADWDRMHQNMRAVVAGQADPLVQPCETLRVMRVLDAIRRSAQTGRVVTLQDEYAP